MIVTGMMALAAAAALHAQPTPVRTGAASMSVGATVIRPEPRPAIAIAGGTVTISNADSAIVTTEGGTANRARDGSILITPAPAGRVTVTLTY